jgi:hypothetical protein
VGVPENALDKRKICYKTRDLLVLKQEKFNHIKTRKSLIMLKQEKVYSFNTRKSLIILKQESLIILKQEKV